MNQPVFWTCPIWNFEKTLCRFFWKISNSEKFLSSKKFKVQKVPTLNSGWTSLVFEPVQLGILKKHFVDFFKNFQTLKIFGLQKFSNFEIFLDFEIFRTLKFFGLQFFFGSSICIQTLAAFAAVSLVLVEKVMRFSMKKSSNGTPPSGVYCKRYCRS